LIAQAKLNEILRNESELSKQLALPPAADLDDETQRQLAPFIHWATGLNVRYCPAAPTTVGAYILAQAAHGIPEKQILDQVAAIEKLHDHYGLPSPVATTAVRFALPASCRSARSKDGDDLMAATRYALMSLRHASTIRSYKNFHRKLVYPRSSIA
jgi:hypothetical protein